MEVWRGEILGVDGFPPLQGIHLHSPLPFAGSLLGRNARLTSLAVIRVSDVPLYLAAGPALDVSSSDDRSAEALEGLLHVQSLYSDDENEDQRSWWDQTVKQSGRGLLVGVSFDGSDDAATQVLQATELLLYAAVVPISVVEGLPTPPRSSSPVSEATHTATNDDRHAQIRVFALPLRRPNVSTTTYDVEAGIDDLPAGQGKAYFIPSLTPSEALAQAAPGVKRRKISNVFQDATQSRKRLQGHGGEGVSKAMAAAAPSLSALNRTKSTSGEHAKNKEAPMDSVEHQSAGEMRRRSLSRASSTASIQSFEPSRPPSRRDSFIPGKRSGLNRVESVLSGPVSPSLPHDANTLEKQNTAALSRIVMAGMRMYGLQQRKKRGSRQPSQQKDDRDVADSPDNSTTAERDEYKMVYHQTFKGACFAFRNHFPKILVPQDAVREVVDRLLLLFCTDPLTKPRVDNHGDQIFGSQEDPVNNDFDLPSAAVPGTIALTPSFRKSKHGHREVRTAQSS